MGRPNKLMLNLIEVLRREIELCYAPGEPIASQRELAQTHGATHSTVRRALQELWREKWVSPIPRVGWIRTPAVGVDSTKPKRQGPLRLGLISRRIRDVWHKNELLPALLTEANCRGIEIIEVPNKRHSTTTRGRSRIELTRVPWNSFDVGLLAEIEDPLTLSDPILRKHRILSVDQDSTLFGFDSIAFANWDAGVIAARHLFDLGHRRFAVTDEINDEGQVHDPSCMARRQGFEFMLSWLGGVIRPEWRIPVQRAGWKKERSIQSVIAGWATRPLKDRPTALFAIESVSLEEIVPACLEHRIQIPDDLSVVTTCWSAAAARQKGIEFAHILLDLKSLIRRTFEAGGQVAAEKSYFNSPKRKAFCLIIPGKLVVGTSTSFIIPR